MKPVDGLPGPTKPQERADEAEDEVIRRYVAMRNLWLPCWGATPPDSRKRPKR